MKSQINVSIVCPWWSRWEVTRVHCKSVEKFIKESPKWVKITYHCILSPGDPDYKELLDIARRHGFHALEYKNKPVANKINAGINTVLEKFTPDYVMNMGSDDLISASIWDAYKPFLDRKAPFFGIDSVYIINSYEKQAYYLDLYNESFPAGVLRMTRADIIKSLWVNNELDFYPSSINSGMDTASMQRLLKVGIIPEVIHTDRRLFTAGLKCNTSINHWVHLTALAKAQKVEYDEVKSILP